MEDKNIGQAETKEERQARLNAEATAKANAAQREKELAEHLAKRAIDDREVLLYSVFPDLHLVVQSEIVETIKMDNGVWRDITTTKNQHIQFRGCKGKARMADMPKIRSFQGYGMTFMEVLDLKDGDKIAVSMEALLAKNDARGYAFCKKMTDNAKRTTIVSMIDERTVRNEIAQQRQKTA